VGHHRQTTAARTGQDRPARLGAAAAGIRGQMLMRMRWRRVGKARQLGESTFDVRRGAGVQEPRATGSEEVEKFRIEIQICLRISEGLKNFLIHKSAGFLCIILVDAEPHELFQQAKKSKVDFLIIYFSRLDKDKQQLFSFWPFQ